MLTQIFFVCQPAPALLNEHRMARRPSQLPRQQQTTPLQAAAAAGAAAFGSSKQNVCKQQQQQEQQHHQGAAAGQHAPGRRWASPAWWCRRGPCRSESRMCRSPVQQTMKQRQHTTKRIKQRQHQEGGLSTPQHSVAQRQQHESAIEQRPSCSRPARHCQYLPAALHQANGSWSAPQAAGIDTHFYENTVAGAEQERALRGVVILDWPGRRRSSSY